MNPALFLFLPIIAAAMGSLPELKTTAAQEQTLTFVVDKSGSGNFTTVQDAVNAVPEHSPIRTVIHIKAGTYREKVVVEDSKVNLTLQGEDYRSTSIEWGDNKETTGSTMLSASVTVKAKNFVAINLSFRNTAPPPSQVSKENGQAVALRISGDQAAFYSCGFYSFQDTLYDKEGRHFFKDCFIQGSVDFIFGNGRSLYVGCQLDSIVAEDKGKVGPGSITAQDRSSANDTTGFSFVNCNVTGSGPTWLGRAWGPYSSVVFVKTCIYIDIASDRWVNMPPNSFTKDTVSYGEYCCSGPGASNAAGGELWKRLTDSEATQFMDISFIDGNNWALPPDVGPIDTSPCGSGTNTGCSCRTTSVDRTQVHRKMIVS